jgi:hypothetical protein
MRKKSGTGFNGKTRPRTSGTICTQARRVALIGKLVWRRDSYQRDRCLNVSDNIGVGVTNAFAKDV